MYFAGCRRNGNPFYSVFRKGSNANLNQFCGTYIVTSFVVFVFITECCGTPLLLNCCTVSYRPTCSSFCFTDNRWIFKNLLPGFLSICGNAEG